ncbi:iron-containing alcohol dehydrogenase [Photobacterium damselae]|uniref:iron-containing alcohol dehydrogenase n=1 Tax=Photobacterium damselae TaxID=38293 RepID=UPI00370C575D
MNNFTFSSPSQIFFGKGQIEAISHAIPKEKKVLVIYGGGSIKQNGVYVQVSRALDGFQWGEFSGIEPNPQYDTLMQAVTVIREQGYDYLLAVGGGSVIDGTKFIAAAVHFTDEPWNLLSKKAPFHDPLPLGCVLTLPATGSETNGGAVISRGNDKLSFGSPSLKPQLAILDPTTTFSLSAKQTANGVVDAFVHVMEQYLTYPVDAKVQDRFAEGLLHTLIEEGPKALADPENYDVRANIMWAATQALNGIIGVGVPQDWTSHHIGHELTAHFGIDHGRTLSIVLPGVMQECRTEKSAKILQYGERIFGLTQGTEQERIDSAITHTISFFQQMGMPTSLAEEGLDHHAIDIVLQGMQKHGMTTEGEYQTVTLSRSRAILEFVL